MLSKIIDFTKAEAFFAQLREEGHTLVQCHGTFDLIHPGHIVHFQEAKSYADKLVVTLTAEDFVNKGPGRPYFNDEMRSLSLAALEYIDYVVVIPYVAAKEAIECVRPDVYCKGKEYKDAQNDVTGNILDDITAVEAVGGRIEYVGSVVFSSTQLINNHLAQKSETLKKFLQTLANDFPPETFKDAVNSLADLRVLIVGDVIIDRYTTVNVQGLTSKNRVVSTRHLEDDFQAGGSLAVYRHLREFVKDVKILGTVGAEPWLEPFLAHHIQPESDWLLREEHFTTIVKQRFVETLSEGKELSKLFAINYIDEYEEALQRDEQIINRLKGVINDFDAVIIMDFGHGLLGSNLRNFLQENAQFLILNCQTNSNNYGFNLINRRYQKADAFCVDEKEIQLATCQRSINPERELKELSDALHSQYSWLTRGSSKSLGMMKGAPAVSCEAFEKSVTDTVGAGDAFLSLASLFAVKQYPLDLTLFAGQLAGSQAVKIIGNRNHIQKSNILKSGMSLLKF